MSTSNTFLMHNGKEVTIDEPLKIAETSDEIFSTNELCRATYKTIYPDITEFHDGYFDSESHYLSSFDKQGKAISSARLVIDSPLGLPEDDYFPPEINMLRKQGKKLMEFGRFVIRDEAQINIKSYYKSLYEIAYAEGVDVIIVAVKKHHVAFHCNKLGGQLLGDMNLTYGGEESLYCVIWDISKTSTRFFNWTGLNKNQRGEQS